MSVSVIIATFGDESAWLPLTALALASVRAQTVECQVIPYHLDASDPRCLGPARNIAATYATREWLLFLDADDELEPTCVAELLAGSGDLRVPAIQKMRDGKPIGAAAPRPRRNLTRSYYVPIGTLIRREAFWSLGGFRAWPWGEDCDLWRRAFGQGMTFVDHPRAVYVQHQRPGSRSSYADQARLWAEMCQ